MKIDLRRCEVCGKSIAGRRIDAVVCGPTCRQRKKRGDSHRAALVRRVNALLERGMQRREIAAKMGISPSYVSDLLHDPTGERAERRRRKQDKACACGRPMMYNAERCIVCAKLKAKKELPTREEIFEALRSWSREHDGATPHPREWRQKPSRAMIVEVVGSWRRAIIEAGLTPLKVGGGRYRGGYRGPVLTDEERRQRKEAAKAEARRRYREDPVYRAENLRRQRERYAARTAGVTT